VWVSLLSHAVHVGYAAQIIFLDLASLVIYDEESNSIKFLIK